MPIRVLYHPQPRSVDLLHCSIREHALLPAVGKQALDGAIREVDLFGPVREMPLNLFVLEFEYLQTVLEGRLSRARICEEVDGLLVGEGLLNVFVGEPHDLVAIRPYLSLHTVCKDHFFPAI